MPKLYVFDLDGTLINSLEDLADSTNYALKKNGFSTYETQKYKYFVGDGVPMLIKRALGERYAEKAQEAVHADFNEFYNEHYADKTRPYKGCEVLLKAIEKQGAKCAVLSNKPDNFVKIIVKKIYPDFNFAWVQGKMEGVPKKPDPSSLLFILRSLGVKKENTLYIGDSNVDVFTGKNAGITTCGVTWGFRGRGELEAAGADYVVDSPEEILKL